MTWIWPRHNLSTFHHAAVALLAIATGCLADGEPGITGGSAGVAGASGAGEVVVTGGSAGVAGASGAGEVVVTGGSAGAAGAEACIESPDDFTEGDSGCYRCTIRSVLWDEETVAGIPAQLFEGVPGTCQASLTWDNTGQTHLSALWSTENVAEQALVTPASGESMLTATIAVDTTSARLITQKYGPATAEVDGPSCPPSLEVDVTVTLELEEGGFVLKDERVTIPQRGIGPLGSDLWIRKEPAEFVDWVSVESTMSDRTVDASIQLEPLADSCAGRIRLSSTKRSIDGSESGSNWPFAFWSTTGCPPGESPINLEMPYRDADLAQAILQRFNEDEFVGEWDAGGSTTLSIDASFPGSLACADGDSDATARVTMPLRLEATSADGRIQDLLVDGTLDATVEEDGTLAALEFHGNAELRCASESDLLAYRTVDCAAIETVPVELTLDSSDIVARPLEGDLRFLITPDDNPPHLDQLDITQAP